MAGNPRRANGTRRNAVLARLRQLDDPCWICGLPIPGGMPRGHPEAMEADEIVPVSKGGSPYDMRNLARAHRCCNNWRRNRSAPAVGAVRSAVEREFGCWSDPQDFVAKAKSVERSRKAGCAAYEPARHTTDW